MKMSSPGIRLSVPPKRFYMETQLKDTPGVLPGWLNVPAILVQAISTTVHPGVEI